MRVPRFRIAWVMIFVAIAALDFAAIRVMFDSPRTQGLISGALLMSNVLAAGILISRQCPECRPFLLGFEAFGALALALYVALVNFFPDPWLDPYIAPSRETLERIIGRDHPLLFYPILIFVVVVMLGGPQVAFALVGGFLSRRIKITVTRR